MISPLWNPLHGHAVGGSVGSAWASREFALKPFKTSLEVRKMFPFINALERKGGRGEGKSMVKWNKCSIAGIKGRGEAGGTIIFHGERKELSFQRNGFARAQGSLCIFIILKWFEFKVIFSD